MEKNDPQTLSNKSWHLFSKTLDCEQRLHDDIHDPTPHLLHVHADTSEVPIECRKAPLMAIVIRLHSLILLEVLGTLVDGVVGQMSVNICQVLLQKVLL